MSFFDLKTDASELSKLGRGKSKMQYDKVTATRDVSNLNFSRGPINFRWETAGLKWWIPDRSYIKLRCSLSNQAGAQLTSADEIAPGMGLAASLFSSIEFRINDKTVSRVRNRVPQVDALKTRLRKSKAWMDSVGKSTNFWESDFKVRQMDTIADSSGDTRQQTRDRVALGYDAATNQVEVSNDGKITFTLNGGAALPLNADVWQVGDVIQITHGADNVGQYTITAINSAVQLQFARDGPSTAVGAAGSPFIRIRQDELQREEREMKDFEITWQPPLSIFDVEHGLPGGRYEIILVPHPASSVQKYAIESLGADKAPNLATAGAPSAGSQYLFEVSDMYLQLSTVEGPRSDDLTYLLDLTQIRCQTQAVPGTSFTQKNFDVSPSTRSLTVAYQDARVGTDTRFSASRFKSYDAAGEAVQDLKLNRFYVNYAGQNLPSPDADPEFVAGRDYTAQRYTDSLIHSGLYFDCGGAEDIVDYHERGSYYHFSWPRDGKDRSTRVNVYNQFDAADVDNMLVLLFDHSSQIVQVEVKDGRVHSVNIQDE